MTTVTSSCGGSTGGQSATTCPPARSFVSSRREAGVLAPPTSTRLSADPPASLRRMTVRGVPPVRVAPPRDRLTPPARVTRAVTFAIYSPPMQATLTETVEAETVPTDDELVEDEDLLVEEISIDGMCGVY
jgi:mycofactocin precursor